MSIFSRTQVARCTLVALAAAMTTSFVSAQTTPWPTKPTADRHQLNAIDFIRTVEAPALDLQAIAAEDIQREQDGEPLRYAIPHDTAITPVNNGTWERLADGTMLWRMRITAPNAKSINLGFTQFRLPKDATLFAYSTDRATALRGFSAIDNADHMQLWTPPINTNDITIELTVAEKAMNDVLLELGSINLGYRTMDDIVLLSGACNNDVVCPLGDDWRDEIPSVGVISTGGSTFCTGVMVNNVRQDRTPYFLTANHCGVGSGNAASLVVFWNYETTTCAGPRDGVLNQFNTGSFFRAASSTSDFTLVELDSDPLEAWGITFSGWNATGAEATTAIAIHHPSTDEKAISFEFQPTTTTTYLGDTVPGNGTHVRVEDWDDGTTEPGSSGSPLYNQDHQIIGQLHGGFAACGNDDADWYGKFSVSWTGGGSSSTRLRDWLDPDATGTLVLNTLGTGLQVEPGGAVVHQGLLGGPFSNNPYVYTLTNPLPDPISYSVSLGAGTAPLTLNGGPGPVSGMLASEATTMVTIGVTGGALAMGTYSRDIVFDDVTSGTSSTNTHSVEVGLVGFSTTPEDALFTGGPVGGPFTGSQVYTLTSTQPSPIMIEVTASDAWIAVKGGAGPAVISLNGLGDSADVTIAYTAVANGLAAGLYNGSVSFTSLSGGSDDTARDVSLDVGRFTYVASGLPSAIPDNGPAGVESVINVTDTYCVGDVDLELAIDHTFVGDLCVELEHNGVVVGVVSRMGADTGEACHSGSPFGCEENNFSIKLDDTGAGGPIENQCSSDLVSPPSYVPNDALAALNGTFVNGEWTLRVIDRAGTDTGSLISWTLKIASAGAVCPPVAEDVAVAIPEIVPADITLVGSSLLNDHDYIITALPSNGQLSDPNGGVINAVPYTLVGMGDVVTYDPSNAFLGSDMFTYEVNDGQPSSPATVSITVGGPQLVYEFNLDSDPGWMRTGQWEFGQPAGIDGDPSAGATGLNVYGYNNGGEYPNSMTEENLTSTVIDCSNLTQTEVRFQRQLGVEHATYDHARFQVSTDGVSFTTVWENQTGFENTLNELSWSQQSYDISAIADGQSTVYLRWKMGTTDTSVTYQGWNIDDIQIWGVQPLAPVTCPWDCRPDNGDGTFGNGLVNIDDLLEVINEFGAGSSPCDNAPDNGDGTFGNGLVNIDDLLGVINNFGSCP